jgi:hypothetical protein
VPSHSRAVEVKLPEAELLAELYGIVSDLEAAAAYCIKAAELEKFSPRDFVVEEALVWAAVIRYGRCFTSGVRLRLGKKDLANFAPGDLADHDHFYALRDRFVAHAICPFEETYVTASATERDGMRLPITRVSPGHHKVLLEGSVGRALGSLIEKVKVEIKRRVAEEESKLLIHIQTLPPEVIHSGDLHSPARILSSHVHKTRKQRSKQT